MRVGVEFDPRAVFVDVFASRLADVDDRIHRRALADGMTRGDIALHLIECDGEPSDPPYSGMDPMPCVICHPKKWVRWAADPYGIYRRDGVKCKRCGGDRRTAQARRTMVNEIRMLDGLYWANCSACDGPVQGRDDVGRARALCMQDCAKVVLGELRL